MITNHETGLPKYDLEALRSAVRQCERDAEGYKNTVHSNVFDQRLRDAREALAKLEAKS